MPNPEKRSLADRAVQRLQDILDPTKQIIQVHWDDCDADEATYWFHIRVPQMKRQEPKTGFSADVALRIREAWKLVKKELGADFTLEVRRQQAPIPRYYSRTEPRVFKEYEGDTWIYVLAIYG